MSSVAQAIIEQIKALPAEEQRVVCEEIAGLAQRRKAWEEQQAKLREMQSRHAGSGLLKRLLEERAKERSALVAHPAHA